MTIPERVNDYLMRQYAKNNLPADSRKEGRLKVLLYAMESIGDLVLYLPAIRAIADRHNLTVACKNPELLDLIAANIGCSLTLSPNERPGEFDAVVCHQLQQWTPIVRKVIEMKIPIRVGHWWREKYSWLWNRKVGWRRDRHYLFNSNLLAESLGAYPQFPHRLAVLGEPRQEYSVLIQPHSSKDPSKDWNGYLGLLSQLQGAAVAIIGSPSEKVVLTQRFGHLTVTILSPETLQDAINQIATARMLIGNNGALATIADNLGIEAIQIFTRGGAHYIPQYRSLNPLSKTMVEPTVQEILREI